MLGKNISKNDFYISRFGIWIYIEDTEYFISFENYPMLKSHSIEELSDYYFDSNHNIHWDKLDIDIEKDSLDNPSKYPLLYK